MLGDLHILGNVDQHRPLSSGIGDLERLDDRFLQILHIPHHVIMLHHRLGHADDVHLLEGILPQILHRHVSRDRNHGNRIQIGVGDSCYEIGGSRAAGGQNYACFPAGSGISVRRVGRPLFMGGKDMPDPIGGQVKLVINI